MTVVIEKLMDDVEYNDEIQRLFKEEEASYFSKI
jgi:hypothetical protein